MIGWVIFFVVMVWIFGVDVGLWLERRKAKRREERWGK